MPAKALGQRGAPWLGKEATRARTSLRQGLHLREDGLAPVRIEHTGNQRKPFDRETLLQGRQGHACIPAPRATSAVCAGPTAATHCTISPICSIAPSPV